MTETTPNVSSPDELESRQRITKTEALSEARELLWTSRHGVLCTLSAKVEGWPFGSIMPYAVDARGRPAICVATIAEHYRNMKHDPRVSLFVRAEGDDDSKDVQTFGRVTVMARARPTTAEELEDVVPRYRFRLPGSKGYSKTHDFTFFSLDIERVRYIGGFGKIFWLDADGFLVDPASDPIAPSADAAVEHMNEDHRHNLCEMLKAFYGETLPPEHVRLSAIDERGMWIEAKDALRWRVDFPRPAQPEQLRQLVIETLQVARARAGA